jgi:hypothetical protein
LAFFANSEFIEGDRSYYISNIHTGNLGLRFNLQNRASLYVGYSHVQDVGDGRSNPFGAQIGSSLPAFQAAQTFPLSFVSPSARLSIRLTEKLRWNVGYQHYGYHEEFYSTNGYRAHTGYTSLLWSF